MFYRRFPQSPLRRLQSWTTLPLRYLGQTRSGGGRNFQKIPDFSRRRFIDVPPSQIIANDVKKRFGWGELRESPLWTVGNFFSKPRLAVIILIPNGGCGSDDCTEVIDARILGGWGLRRIRLRVHCRPLNLAAHVKKMVASNHENPKKHVSIFVAFLMMIVAV